MWNDINTRLEPGRNIVVVDNDSTAGVYAIKYLGDDIILDDSDE